MANLLTVSVQGGIVILAVAALRMMLKKAPKRLVCLLWLLAGARLLLPFQIESSLSLQPNYNRGSVWEGVQAIVAPEDHSGNGWGKILDAQGNVLVSKPLEPTPGRGEILDSQGNILVSKPLGTDSQFPKTEKTETNWKKSLPYIWLLGMVAMGASSVIAYLRLKKRVRESVILEEGVWVTGNIDTAFVLGFFRPQIYLPVWLAEEHREFVLAHECSHIARRDHWWKLLGYIALSIHWFNPLVWLGYILLCRDLEMACDENVVKTMDLARRKAYSAALVSCSAVHPTIAACPVAFGEISVKERVKNVLKFQKPGFWISLTAILAAIFVAVFLMTSPAMTEEEILEKLYQQIQEFQNSQEKHAVMTIDMDSEFAYVTSQRQEVWNCGDDMYLHIDYETPMGSFEEGYMQLDGIQYAMDHSEEIEEFEDRPWAGIPEENYVKDWGLYTKDFTKLEVLEIREENGEHVVILKDDKTVTEPEKIYEATYTFRLDGKGKLLGISRYSYQNVYMSGFGKEGYFDTKSTNTFEILVFDAAEFAQKMNGVCTELKLPEYTPETKLALRAGYKGPGEEYTYFHSTEREKKWEEDVLFLAEKLLTEHPYVTDDNFFIVTGLDTEYSNAMFDPELRNSVITQVNQLIPELGELSDTQILWELQRIMALLEDADTSMSVRHYDGEKILPLVLETIYVNGEMNLYATRIPAVYESVLYTKLTAINGIPVEEVIAKVAPYVVASNENMKVQRMVGLMRTHTALQNKDVLQILGIVGPEEDSAELTFETESGMENCRLEFVSMDEYWDVEYILGTLSDSKPVQYRYVDDKMYWYEILAGNIIYVNIVTLFKYEQRGFDLEKFLIEVDSVLKKAKEPMRLVMDFRIAGSGYDFHDEFSSFAKRVNQRETNGVYILINGVTYDAGADAAYRLSREIDGAKLVGTPAGSGVNYLTSTVNYTLPNSGLKFYLNTKLRMDYPEYTANTLTPDVVIYQSLEDYKNGIDTVFEAAVNGLQREFTIFLGTATVTEPEE